VESDLKISNGPHSIEAEEALTSAILSTPEAINTVLADLKPEMFWDPLLQKTFRACIDIVQNRGEVDLITVSHELRQRGAGTDDIIRLTDISGNILRDSMAEHYALIIKQTYILRQYMAFGTEIVETASTEDLQVVAELAENTIFKLSGMMQKREPLQVGIIVEDKIKEISRAISGEVSLTGVTSGFSNLDHTTGGFRPGELSIIAGRPGMGKTALGLVIAWNAAKEGHPVAYFSCEMSNPELASRFISGASGYTNSELSQGNCRIEQVCESTVGFLDLPLYVDDTAALTILELRAKCRRLILRYKVELVVVDYLQLMAGQGHNREQEISYISRNLKAIAKDLNISIIALSQLNREAESREDKRPRLSDLRESGAIEQDADRVLMVYRPAYYKTIGPTINFCGVDTDTKGLLILDICKNRNGMTGELSLKHNESMTWIHE